MNFNGWSNFEDLARACGYTNLNNDSNDNSNNSANNTSTNNDSSNSDNNNCNTNDSSNCSNNNSNNSGGTNQFDNTGCFDIPNGFQSLNPDLFVAIGGILGQIMAGNLPFNVQNALGNWFELLGQVILTYNAQQQYFQGGPARYFNPQNYNAANQFCTTTQNTTTQNSSSSKSKKKNSKKNNTDNSNYENSNNSCSQNNVAKINELECRINDLMAEIQLIKDNTL